MSEDNCLVIFNQFMEEFRREYSKLYNELKFANTLLNKLVEFVNTFGLHSTKIRLCLEPNEWLMFQKVYSEFREILNTKNNSSEVVSIVKCKDFVKSEPIEIVLSSDEDEPVVPTDVNRKEDLLWKNQSNQTNGHSYHCTAESCAMPWTPMSTPMQLPVKAEQPQQSEPPKQVSNQLNDIPSYANMKGSERSSGQDSAATNPNKLKNRIDTIVERNDSLVSTIKTYKEWVCPQPECGYRNYSERNVKLHERVHRPGYAEEEKKVIKCPVAECNTEFMSNLGIKTHLRFVHMNQPNKRYKCELPGCKYQTSYMEVLRRHVTTRHVGGPRPKTPAPEPVKTFVGDISARRQSDNYDGNNWRPFPTNHLASGVNEEALKKKWDNMVRAWEHSSFRERLAKVTDSDAKAHQATQSIGTEHQASNQLMPKQIFSHYN